MEKIARIMLVVMVAVTAVAGVSALARADDRPYNHRHVVIPTRPCATEDDVSCYWDAGVRGDTNGYSYWVGAAGGVYYLDPTR